MKITRVSQYSGKERTMEIPCTPEQLHAYNEGELIQIAMPQLNDEQREFIMTGITSEEWDKMFPPEDEQSVEYWYNKEPAF